MLAVPGFLNMKITLGYAQTICINHRQVGLKENIRMINHPSDPL